VQKIEDLREGMTLQGTVTNVVAFGAFVDVGVHQDGLVHVSELSDRFVQDPNAAARVGDRVTVRVLSVDVPRKRIALSMRSGEGRPKGDARRPERQPDRRPGAGQGSPPKPPPPSGVAPNGMRITKR
jgi:uncharacterized protein